MSEVRRHEEQETTVVAEQTPGTAQSRVPRSFGMLSNKVRNAVAAALVALAPVYGSCAAQVETDDTVAENGGGDALRSPENNNVQERMVFLSGNKGAEWRFQGNYPIDFKLVVSVDGTVVDSQIVTVDPTVDPSLSEQFYVEGPLGNDSKNVHVQAFDLDGQEIAIHANINKPGMIGQPDLPVGLE